MRLTRIGVFVGQDGLHVVLNLDDEIVAHAAVVERELHVDGRPLRTGYVEAVATAPDRQGIGLGSRLMADVASYIRETFELGALGTGRHHFYERLGWLTWAGPSFVRTADGVQPTPEDDGYILVLPTPSSPVGTPHRGSSSGKSPTRQRGNLRTAVTFFF